MPRGNPPVIAHHLYRPNNIMKWRELLHLPEKNRRTRSKARSETGPAEGQNRVDLAASVPRPTESTPDLQNQMSTSALPLAMPSPSASRDQESNGMQSTLSRTIRLTHLSRNTDPRTVSDRIPSVSREGGSESNPSKRSVGPSAINENTSDLKSLASSGAKFILRGVKESADAFPPLKSAASALWFILNNCEVWSTSVNRPIRNAYSRPRKRQHVANP